MDGHNLKVSGKLLPGPIPGGNGFANSSLTVGTLKSTQNTTFGGRFWPGRWAVLTAVATSPSLETSSAEGVKVGRRGSRPYRCWGEAAAFIQGWPRGSGWTNPALAEQCRYSGRPRWSFQRQSKDTTKAISAKASGEGSGTMDRSAMKPPPSNPPSAETFNV